MDFVRGLSGGGIMEIAAKVGRRTLLEIKPGQWHYSHEMDEEEEKGDNWEGPCTWLSLLSPLGRDTSQVLHAKDGGFRYPEVRSTLAIFGFFTRTSWGQSY
jgi:hypothetical protein